ncbi:MAG: peptidoglycan DD-metalloendopeptidase family protein, partial [Succinivibrio sp.]
PYNITVGQIIYFDDKETTQTVKTAAADTKKPVPYAELEKEKKQAKSVASAKTESDIYVVKNGDSVMSVSRKTGVSFSNIIKYNKLKKPYALYTGQKLHLKDDGSLKKTSATVDTEVVKTNTEVAKTVPVAGAETGEKREDTAYVEIPATSAKVVSGKSKVVSGVRWMWPAKGKVVANFSSVNKGIDISGTRGQDINAAADGQVVYSGNALRGYGNLIIINHNNEFLSAYAHNDMLLVKEGQKVKRGQVIAKMGSTDTSSVKLHFEIRYKGNSVNPRKYLP